jgi:Carbohydrate-selective porin, OprB family
VSIVELLNINGKLECRNQKINIAECSLRYSIFKKITSVRKSINTMTNSQSRNLLSPILIGLAVWMTGASSVTANPSSTKANSTIPQSTATSPSLKVTNDLATTLGNEPTAEQINQATESVEVKPSDWAYQTLQALNAKYSCSDMPTGNRALSREEFATSLNGCIQSMEQLVARKPRKAIKKRKAAPAPVAPEVVTPPPAAPEVAPPVPVQPPAPPEVSQQDLDQLKQLVQSFGTELQGVDARIKAIDTRITDLKEKSFSTTTKLVGEAIFAVTGLAGGPSTATRSTIFSDRVRLNFRSSFTGKDLLLVRLQSRNSNSFAGSATTSAAKTNMARLGFEGSDDNATTLHRLQYQLPITPSTKVFVEAVGSEFNDNYYTFNPEHQAAGTGSISRFGRFAPIYRLSNEGAGIGVDHKFNPNLGLVLSYAVPRVGVPGVPGTAPESVSSPTNVGTNGSGLFNGSNVLFSQLTVKPSEDVSLGLAYARSYNSAGTGLSGANGSNFANNPFSSTAATLVPTTANHYTLVGSVNLSKDLILSAWGGLTQATRETGAGGSAEIWNYAATLAAKDFGSKGSTLGFVVGMQPRVASNNASRLVAGVVTPGNVDKDTSMHIEAFYKYKVSDNLFITPGLLILTNPEHNAANPTEYLGTIRSTFVF